ncbi:hypothetical protein ACIBO4_31070 [Streptomyces sp. NPDC050149]|uniref:hypothetical protein n=1 Tax=Streptomyces sp. NPDC050149 TaxID=3365603 RepID=UPI0037BD07B3
MGQSERARRSIGVLTVILLGITGCTVAGGGGAGESGHGLRIQPEASASAMAPGGLDHLSLTSGDAAGYSIGVLDGAAQVHRSDVVADEVCRALAYVLAGAAPGSPASTSVRRALGKKSETVVALASYTDSRAVGILTDLSTAADACPSGFDLTVRGQERHVTKVSRALAPPGTDQAMAFDMTVETGGTKEHAQVIVVRKGSTIGIFSSSPAGAAKPPANFAVPAPVVEAQLIKLG